MINKLKTTNLLIGIVVGVLLTIATGITIWNHYESSYRLNAFALSTQAPIPPKLDRDLKKLHEFDLAEILKRYSRDENFPTITDQELKKAIPEFSKIVKDRIDGMFRFKILMHEYLTIITVQNHGKKTVRNAKLQMPYAFKGNIVYVDKGRGDPKVLDFNGLLDLGDIHPRSETKIFIYDNIAPLPAYGIISHEEGIIEISMHRNVPQWIAKHGGIYISYYWTTIALSVAVIILLFGSFLWRRIILFNRKTD